MNLPLSERLASDLAQFGRELVSAKEQCRLLECKIGYIRELLSAGTAIPAATLSPRVAVRPRIQRQTKPLPKSDDSEDSDQSYLGEIRRAITTIEEPFTKSMVQAAVQAENPGCNSKAVNSNIQNGFGYLRRTGKILEDPTQDRDLPGEGRWVRAGNVSATIGNKCPLIEPSTGKTWESIQELIRDMGLDDAHRVYRAIAAGEPLENGRAIEYLNGHGQRKAGEPVNPASEAPRTRIVFPADDGGVVEDVQSESLIGATV